MKRYILVFAVLTFVAGVAVTSLSNGKTQEMKTNRGVLNVGDVQADPYAYKGSITITGVVAKFSKDDQKLFSIIDTAEAKHCKSIGCAKFYLPVKYEKEIPREWDEINATGRFVEKGGLLFEATKIEVLRHLNPEKLK